MREIDKELGDYKILAYTPTTFMSTEINKKKQPKEKATLPGAPSKRSPEALARKAERQRELRKEKRAERITMPDGTLFHVDAPHGTWSGVNTYGCRCKLCFDLVKAHDSRKNKQGEKYGAS